MLRYRINRYGVELALNSSAPHTPAPIEITGDPDMVAIALDWLADQNGAYGHILTPDDATPVDLAAAIAKNPQCVPELLEGAELVADFSLNLPDGAVS